MLHEILITLTGKSGNLLENIESIFDLGKFLHPHEIQLTKHLLTIAKNYKFIQDYINLNRNRSSEPAGNRATSSLYIQAFSEAVDEILRPYLEELISLEQKLLSSSSSNFTLTYINAQVQPYSSIICLLRALIEEILSKKIHGCRILQLIYDTKLAKVDDIATSLDKILQHCHGVLLKQISNWVLNGHLIDPYKEFFIELHQTQKYGTNYSNGHTSHLSSQFLEKEEIFVEPRLAVQCIPSYLPYSLITDILFVGQTIATINENPKNKSALVSGINDIVFGDQKIILLKNFHSFLKNPHFVLNDLDEAVQNIRICVVQHLWKVAVEEENLFDEFQLIKNIYLLGHGELFKEFLFHTKSKSNSKYTSIIHLVQDWNWYLQKSAYAVDSIDDSMLEKFSFVTAAQNFDSTAGTAKSSLFKSGEVWSLVSLEYKTSWPLNLVFTPNVIFHYNKLLMLLLRVKKCHIDIQAVWFADIKNKKNRKYGTAWKLRTELMFIINNLEFYLQVDVIESEYSILLNSLGKVNDFQEIIRLHHKFLLNILNQSFISWVQDDNERDTNELISSTKPHVVYATLSKILKICEKFCTLVSKDGFNESKIKELNLLSNKFDKHKDILICLLFNLQSQPLKGNLSKLFLRLNYNFWFMKNTPMVKI